MNTCNQKINNLKLQNNGSGGGSGSGKLCCDCGEQGVVKGHPGCENKGENLFLPENLKKQKDKQKNKDKDDKDAKGGNTEPAIHRDPFPDNDEKMFKGEKCLLCRKCNHFTCDNVKKDGMWQKASTPSAHKTADHKVKGQNLALVTEPANFLHELSSPTEKTSHCSCCEWSQTWRRDLH